MIHDVGFFVHQWNLRNKDLVVFVYVRCWPSSSCSLASPPLSHKHMSLLGYLHTYCPTLRLLMADTLPQNIYTYLTSYAVMMFFAKTAILLEWIRIFVADRQRNVFFWSACVLIGLNLGVYGAGAIATGLACIPREKLWHPWVSGRCIDRHTLDSFTAFVNLAIDLGILLLPQRVIWRLQMSRQRKIGLSVLFSVGIIACASAAGRAYYTVTLDFGGDVTYTASPAFLFGHAEMTTVLMVFCIPSVPKAFEGSGLGAKFRSWTRLSSSGIASGNTDQQGKPANGSAPGSSESWRPAMRQKTHGHSYPQADEESH
ncbi:hypothetical protein F4808DRAFT_411846 [Astrocystis sublimbata]|nr:hypothetical protein F4808DRAFT_411846 [Astrocystis sublimbata]